MMGKIILCITPQLVRHTLNTSQDFNQSFGNKGPFYFSEVLYSIDYESYLALAYCGLFWFITACCWLHRIILSQSDRYIIFNII